MLKTGEVAFGKYRILGLLGKGGMGSVYLAENINVGNKWAIKEIEIVKNRSLNLLVEPEMLKRLNHPHLPRIVDVIRTANSICIIEDYFEGQSLQQVLENRQMCSESNVIKWCRQLAEILIYLHNLQPIPIIYSDLKPGNIIIDTNLNLKLVDFGIAREYSGSSSQGAYGSRGYAAPEQFHGIYDERTDIYSFGATFYHVLSGSRFDPRNPVGLREFNQQFSEGIDHIIARCLQMNPSQRYQSAEELFKDLKFIDRLSSDYRKKVYKKKMALAVYLGMILAGCLVFMFGFDRMDATTLDLFQQRINSGIQLTAEGRYDAAEASFKEALNYRNDPEVFKNLARLYLRANKSTQALNYIKEKIQTGDLKNDTSTAYLLGTAYYDLQDYNNAIIYFKQSLQATASIPGADYEVAMRDLAVCYSRNHEFAKAEETLQQLEQNKGSTNSVTDYVHGEINLAKKDFQASEHYFEKARTANPNNIEYILGSGRLYNTWSESSSSINEKIARLKKARDLLLQGEKIDEHHIQVLTDLGSYSYELGQLFESTGDVDSNTAFQQARLAFTKLKDLDSQAANTYLNLAMVYDKLDNFSEAENNFQESLRLDEGSSHANFIYGLFKLKHKQYTEAYQYLQKTVSLNKNSYEVSAARAKISELKEKGWL